MEIYAEYLFLENFVAGFFILLLTGKICGRQIRKGRLVLGSILCGIYAFSIVLNSGFAIALLGRVVFSAFVVIMTFSLFPAPRVDMVSRMRVGVKIWITFYIVSFIMGGITIAYLYLGGVSGVTRGGAVYIESVTYFHVVIGMILTWTIGSLFAGYIKDRVRTEKVFRETIVEIGGETWVFRAMIDTGNFLKEPLTGKPVAVICQSAAEEILKSGKAGKERFSAIPYKSVGSAGGVLLGFRVDKVIMEGKVIRNMVLAIYEGEFNKEKEGEAYRLLMSRELLEGGIAV